jgi:hypothetical protein
MLLFGVPAIPSKENPGAMMNLTPHKKRGYSTTGNEEYIILDT